MRATLINIGLAVMLIVGILMNAGPATATNNVPWDGGNGDGLLNDEWENELQVNGTTVDGNFEVDAGETITYDSDDASTFTINENMTIADTGTLTFKGVSVIMNGSLPEVAYGGNVSIAGTMILINSTWDLNHGYINVADGLLILDNSSIIDCDRITVTATTAVSKVLLFNSNVSFLATRATSAGNVNAYIWAVNTAYDYGTITLTDATAPSTGEVSMIIGYQHYLIWDDLTEADTANRTFTIRDYRGNTTQTDWYATIDGVNFRPYLHMPDVNAKNVRSFGTTECILTYGSLIVPVSRAYTISYEGNGTSGLNVTIDYPETWKDASVEVFGHTTGLMVANRNTTDDSPFHESPYADDADGTTENTGRNHFGETIPMDRDTFEDTIDVPVEKEESLEVNYVNLIAYAGADTEANIGDIVSLTGTATTSGHSSALSYSWEVYDPTMSTVITTLTGRTGQLNLTETYFDVNDTYYVILTVQNVEGSYSTDTRAIDIVPPEDEGTNGSQTGGEDEDEDTWSWRHWDSWAIWRHDVRAHMWDEIQNFWNTYCETWTFWIIVGAVAVVLFFVWTPYRKFVLRIKRFFWK